MKYNLLYLSILLSIVFSSCEKENFPDIENTGNALLFKVLISGEVYMEYTSTSSGFIYEEKSKYHYTKHTYNSSNLVEKSESYWDPSIVSSSSYAFDEAMKRKEWVNPQNTPISVTNTYVYNQNGQLIQLNTERDNGYRSYSKYEYNGKGQVSKKIFYNEDKPGGFIEFFYDGSGNLIKRLHYYSLNDGTAELQTTTEYEYDTMHNPYLAFRQLLNPGSYTNPNNITKETYILLGDLPKGIERVQITSNIYEYNELGYPVKVNDETVYEYE
jgi:hypothetical protein